MLYSLARAWRLILVGLVIIGSGFAGYHYYAAHQSTETYLTPQEKDPYVRFDMEAFDSISENYWVKPGEYARFGMPGELPEIFRLALDKSGAGTPLATTTRAGVAEMLKTAFQNATSTDARRQLAINTLQVVLYNLTPVARDGLLSKQEETALRQDVANINPTNDLYDNLGVQKGASSDEVEKAYQEKTAVLAAATTTEAKQELKQVSYAHEVLSNPVGKTLYDTTGAESSVFPHVFGTTLYMDFDKISPSTLQEFALAIEAASTTPLSNLILDMRGNVGGQLSFAQDFLGLFLGGNQYAFDLYHQGNTEPARTTQNKFPDLSRYKHIAVFTDAMTQSTAELTTAGLKRFHLATVIGTKTRGWGSVEDTYPMKTEIDPATSYALLLVNHLTLRDDNEPIEQNGVIPDIDTTVAGWQKNLSDYFDSSSFIGVIETRLASDPLK